jgi:hypothetical protein
MLLATKQRRPRREEILSQMTEPAEMRCFGMADYRSELAENKPNSGDRR